MLCAEDGLAVFFQQLRQFCILTHGQVARQILDFTGCADGHRPGLQGPVDAGVIFLNGLDRGGADVAFHPHVIGNDVYQVAAAGDDGMEADVIFFAEGFAQGVDAHEAQHGRVQGVDAVVRSRRGVRRLAMVFDELADKAVAGTSELYFTLRVVRRRDVHLHRRVDIVEAALVNNFFLAAEEMNFSLIPQGIPVFDFNAFFSRHGE